MPHSQQNRLLKEADPSSWFSTDVTFVVGSATTQISAKSPVQPNQGNDLPSSAAAVLNSALRPGIRFGPFRLIKRLGGGAQGDVWKARRHEPHVDIVALKVLSPAQARQPHRLAQFRREAERGTRLVGPSLLQVFEFGEIDGFPYMAMPFVEGTTLQQVIRRRQTYLKGEPVDLVHRLISLDEELYLPTAVRVMSKAARALGLVHACHVAHRDVKPANILLDGHHACGVYLCDLGLGRDLEIATSEQMRDGAGTPMYMAPERLLKAPADEILCDLYSLGVTLFETFTLGRPFDTPGETPPACLSAKLASTKPKEPRKLKPDLPADLEAIILKAMSRNPRDRHQSAQEIAGELDQFLARRYSRAGRIIADHAKVGGPAAHIVMIPPHPAARIIAGRCPL
ncbi:MAG TPA: serine/threonine-protein kinase [Isosphaeraceae bacterium]|nr:serine/threonine-protein kinase [Isosphaeraceae bacterium]